MKKLGLIGGMGPESTVPYYYGIVYGVQKGLGEHIFPNLTIESIDVFKVLVYCKEKKYEELFLYLRSAIDNLVNAGAEFIALSANTPHIIFDRLKDYSPVKMISIVDCTCCEAKKLNYKRIGLIGTKFTMAEDFFKKPFINNDIEIIIPFPVEIDYINDKIACELELGVVKEETLSGFQNIIERMRTESGIEAIILGCTELPLLLNDSNCCVPCLDTAKIHIKSLVKEILN